MTVLISWFIALLAVSCYGQENAEIEVSLSREGLNYAIGLAIDILTGFLQNLKLPDFAIFNNIRITQFNRPSANLSLGNGTGMTLSLDNAFLKIDADWKWEIEIFNGHSLRDSGSITISSRVGIILSVIIGSQNGSPTINAYSCLVSLPNLNITVSGTGIRASYNSLLNRFKDKIRSLIESQLCETTQWIINERGAQLLSTLPLEKSLNDFLTLSYSLPKPPYFSTNFLKIYLKGTFEGDNVTNQTPLMNTPTDKMIGISISENFFNSACRVLYNKGVAKYTYTLDGSNIPTQAIQFLQAFLDEPFQNATQAIPFLQDTANRSFEINIHASSVPTVTISSSGIAINFSGVIDVVSKLSGQAERNILHVKFQVEAAATAHISSNILKGSVIYVIPHVQEINPAIQNMSEEEVNDSLRQLFTDIIPQINDIISVGVRLPSVDTFVYVDYSLVLNDRYLSVSADISNIS